MKRLAFAFSFACAVFFVLADDEVVSSSSSAQAWMDTAACADTEAVISLAWGAEPVKLVYSGSNWELGDGEASAIVKDNGSEIANFSGEGVFEWTPTAAGNHVLTHSVGGVMLSRKFMVSPEPSPVVVSSASSPSSFIDTRAGTGEVLTPQASEPIVWSGLWAADADAAVAVTVNGESFVSGRGEGVAEWMPLAAGVYAFRHETKGSGEVLTATFEIEPKSLAQARVVIGGAEAVYDGTAFEPEVESVVLDGRALVEGTDYSVSYSDNVNAGVAAMVINGINFYGDAYTTNFTIMKRVVTLTSGSASKMYDGKPQTEHSVVVGGDAFVDGEGATFDVTGSQTDVGSSANTFTYALNDGTKVDNYAITAVYGTLTVTKATVGPGGGEEPGGGEVPEGGESKFDVTLMYDGEGHAIETNALAVAFAGEMVGDVAVEYAVDDGSGAGHAALPWTAEPPVFTNAGEYVVLYRVTNPNYADFVHAAKVTITNRPVTVTVTGRTAEYVYDGSEMCVEGFDLATDDGLYELGTKTYFGGVACSVTRKDAGTSYMGLSASQFANGDANFEVTYSVTDGWVKINPVDISIDTAHGDFSLVLGANPKYDGTEQTVPVASATYKGMAVDYTLVGENATHAGYHTLTIMGNGNFTGERSTTWQMLKRAVTFTSGSASKPYDGTALVNGSVEVGGDGFVDGEGATFDVTGSQTAAGSSKNTFAYALKAGTLAGDYEISKIEGDLVVTKATVVPGGGEEPGDGEVPDGGESKFDVTLMYDGEGHAIDTNALAAAFAGVIVDDVSVEYAVDDESVAGHAALPWTAEPPVFTNAGEYVVWYRVTNLNYADFVHAAKVTIEKRAVTLTSGSASKEQDGKSLVKHTVVVGSDGFASGEGATYSYTGSQTDVGSSENTFTYTLNEGTKAENYDVAMVYGALTVTKAIRIVTFNANGGKSAETQRQVERGCAIGLLPIPTRSGHAFAGWWTAKTGGAMITSMSKVTKDTTYYARWTANKYKIKFNANGGTGTMKVLSATYGKDVTLAANAYKRSKHTFLGWATKKDGAVAYKNKASVKNLTAKDGKTVTLYAVWKPDSYTVNFNANGGAGTAQRQEVVCGAKTKLAANVYKREGFVFAGWATKKDGLVVYKNKATVKGLAKKGKTVTLYAVWKPTKWAVGTFNGTGEFGGKAATATLTVSSEGKISGKFVVTKGKKTYSFKVDRFDGFSEGALRVTTPLKIGSKTYALDIAVGQAARDDGVGVTFAEMEASIGDRVYATAFLGTVLSR